MYSFWKMGKDLFKKLKQQFHEFITPSLNNIFDSQHQVYVFINLWHQCVYLKSMHMYIYYYGIYE